MLLLILNGNSRTRRTFQIQLPGITMKPYGTLSETRDVTYVRLVASNSTATCQAYSETFTINIGEPRLEAPNVFSPGTSPGVNDEWKVAYKSIVSFKCWIFNKWGVQMFYFDSPDQGWDGKYRGKYVDPGVYYYVIEAKGANNKKMKLKGHINILRPKN